MFEQSPFYEFPKVAARCCAKTGCYAKVKAAFESITAEFETATPSPNKPKTSKSLALGERLNLLDDVADR